MNELMEKIDQTAVRTFPLIMQGGVEIHKLALYTAVLNAMEILLNSKDDNFLDELCEMTKFTASSLKELSAMHDAILKASKS